MTVVPLPASPCVRVRLIYNEGSAGEGGNRVYFSYSGTPPSGADCTALASGVATAWAGNLQGLIPANYSLDEVDVLDIATDSGLSGQWHGADAGTRAGSYLPANVATNVEFGIARRYRGGKPRFFLPPGVQGDLESQGAWSAGYVSSVNEAVVNFFNAVQELSPGTIGTLQHVNLSYYKGFTNITNSSGRERAVPQYRDQALLDTVTGYSAKAVVGSQRRRRTSTTP